MKITLFTSDRARHVALAERLTEFADELRVIQERIPPTETTAEDDVLTRYFDHVRNAEYSVFGALRPLANDVHGLSINYGELSGLPLSDLESALDADVVLVYGASFIRGPLADALVARRAVNIHMGTSPFYRGSATNFWALYDRRPAYVGATVHLLTKGLDSGPMLLHAFPPTEPCDPFLLGMRAVDAAFAAVVENLASNELLQLHPIPQDRGLEMRYARISDFTSEIAAEYLNRLPSPDEIHSALTARDLSLFVRPYVQRHTAAP